MNRADRIYPLEPGPDETDLDMIFPRDDDLADIEHDDEESDDTIR